MPSSGEPTLDQLLYGIREQESGGDYAVVNSIGAVGAYQMLKSNIPEWTKEALGHSLTWQQFRDDKNAQDTTARYKIGQYYQKYGARGAASAWYSGNPSLSESTRSQSGGPSIKDYVDSVIATALKSGSGITGSSPGGSVQQADSIFSWPSDIVNFFKNAYDDLTATAHFFSLFFRPSTYVRIGAGFFGTLLIILGIICLAIEAKDS